jgi:hypothetical protein
MLGASGSFRSRSMLHLVALGADPVKDIHNTRRIERVMQEGVWAPGVIGN